MRVLAINYPKKEEDETKIELLVKNYQLTIAPGVETELRETKIPDFNLLEKVKNPASFLLQF